MAEPLQEAACAEVQPAVIRGQSMAAPVTRGHRALCRKAVGGALRKPLGRAEWRRGQGRPLSGERQPPGPRGCGSECGAHLMRHCSCGGDIRFQEQTVATSQGDARGPAPRCTWQRWEAGVFGAYLGRVGRCSDALGMFGGREEKAAGACMRVWAQGGLARRWALTRLHRYSLCTCQVPPCARPRGHPCPTPPPVLPPLGPLCSLCFHVLPLLSACKVSVMPNF